MKKTHNKAVNNIRYRFALFCQLLKTLALQNMKKLFILLVFASSILSSQNNYACCINVDELKIKELKEKNIDT